jgi:hypothetical protein
MHKEALKTHNCKNNKDENNKLLPQLKQHKWLEDNLELHVGKKMRILKTIKKSRELIILQNMLTYRLVKMLRISSNTSRDTSHKK